MMYTRHDLVMAVREMLERHWDVAEIATKLHIDIATIQSIIDLLT
jgi:DNA-binding MarR family transcriptional regulator